MKRLSAYLLAFIAALSLLQGCLGRGRVIPKDAMSRIYAEMFVADQWLRDHPDSRKTADTTLFYDPILKKYGYNARDYDASIRYYSKHTDRYSKVLDKSSEILENEVKRLKDIKYKQELVRKLNSFESSYEYNDFSDSTSWNKTIADSIFIIRKDNAERRDSVRTDSLETARQFIGTEFIATKRESL